MSEYALVTGGSRNIGRAICERLQADGYKVIQFDVIEPENPEAAEFHQVDLGDTEATAAALAAITKDRPVTRLVNNVGIFRGGLLDDATLEDFDAVMRVNTRCALQCAKALAPGMREAGFGRIVNIASRAVMGIPGLSNYSASKAALLGFTRTWSIELARSGVTVNAIAPGPINTDMLRQANPPGSNSARLLEESIPVGRLGEPTDIANGISFFLDQRTSFVTGQLLHVCGGMSFSRAP